MAAFLRHVWRVLARLTASAVFGVQAIPVSVEVDVSPGLPGTTMVGLPDTTVRESRDRVRTAIRNSGFLFPAERVTVSLAPADVRKVGAAFDLPIALGILAASGALPYREERRFTIVGGLSLDGGIPPMCGLLPIAVSARETTGSIVFPSANLQEAGIIRGLKLFPARSLMDAARILIAPDPHPHEPPADEPFSLLPISEDLADVRGQLTGRHALEVAAAGGHNLLLSGPPGAGKTMLARRLPGILPPLDLNEALTVTTIHSVAGRLTEGTGLIRQRPFRAPHHTCSDVALVGGGSTPRPGELSLAHGGVLFLDELPEFSRRVLETLRQPLELRVVHIARASRSVTFPADVMLVGAMNPCPCGYFGNEHRVCRCTPSTIGRYRQRLSGPLRDRFDLALEIPALPWADMRVSQPSESSEQVRGRVVRSRERQLARQGCTNARLEGKALGRACRLADSRAEHLLQLGATRFQLSARAVNRVLRVARTLADLESREDVGSAQITEALLFRLPDETLATT